MNKFEKRLLTLTSVMNSDGRDYKWPRWFRRIFVLTFPISIPIWIIISFGIVFTLLPISIIYDLWND